MSRICMDVGDHFGETAELVLEARLAFDKVCCFEPSSRCTQKLSDLASLNKELDSIYAVLCAAGYNIRWLMRMILQKSIKPYLFLFFAKELQALFENLKQMAARFQTNPINHHPRLA